jgi:hypothetical protein
MAWNASSAKALEELAGTYALKGGCWAVLTIHPSPPKKAEDAAKCPEGYGYTWAVLAPGVPPNHLAHRHFPDWKDVKTIRGQEWPVAGPGIQLETPPATPHDFWLCCMGCLEHVLIELGLDMPNEEQLLAGHMLEKDFRQIQQRLSPGKPTGLAR